MEANGAMLGVSLLLDDMLRSEKEAAPLQLQGQADSDITMKTDREVLILADVKDLPILKLLQTQCVVFEVKSFLNM